MKKLILLLFTITLSTPADTNQYLTLESKLEGKIGKAMGVVKVCQHLFQLYVDDQRVEQIQSTFRNSSAYQQQYQQFMHDFMQNGNTNSQGHTVCKDMDTVINEIHSGIGG